jgi:hypothetical protein
MVKELIYLKMEINTLENIKMENLMVKDNIYGLMVVFMMEDLSKV